MTRASQTALRRGETATWGPRPPELPRIKFTPWRNTAGTVRGLIDATLPSGLVINGMKLMIGPKGKPWVAMPAVKQVGQDGQPQLDANGKALWNQIIQFRDQATRDKFRDLIIEALRRQHPKALAGGDAS
jgi:DNA-binding cell septation regulator SpoVG